MTWQELEDAAPHELLLMSADLSASFPPLALDASVTIGMAAHGNITTTIFALRALFASVCGDFELILIDDASPDETGKLFELVSRVHHTTKVFRFARNIEYSGSLNTILSHASGDYIIFVSNDIFITPSYIKQLLAVAQKLPDSGIVRGCSNFVDNGLITHNIKDCGDLDNFEVLFSFARKRAAEFDGQCLDDPFLTGDAFLVTRAVLDSIGFLDPRFYGYFVDHDLGIRARRAGFRPRLALGAFAWHQHDANMDYLAQQAKQEKVRLRWARVNENWARFKDKYNLPVNLPYNGMRRIPWDGLAALPSGEIFPPGNHAAFCVPQPGTVAWKRYRASDMASQARKLMQAARLDDAEKLCVAALDLLENSSDALTMLGSIQVYQGRVGAGIKTFRQAIKVDPTNFKAHSNLLLSMNYTQDCSQLAMYRESKRWEKLHGVFAAKEAPAPPMRSRIRIGYISPDFRRHSVGYFILPVLENHDRNKFEVFCFSDAPAPDDMTRRMAACADGWRDIAGLTNDEVAAVVREAAPDILVDLAGHTGQVIRLPIFARRLAPVQVTWLGYPNTTGLNAMDYRLTDEAADPMAEAADQYYSEKLIRLPNGFLCYRPPEDAPEVSPLPALANGAITFGCFNMLPKIQDVMISAWCDILKQVPNSRLILKNHFFRDSATARRTAHKFARYGITDKHLSLLPSDPDTASHLAQYGRIDIALDTFPYNGTTTTCEALWMGVPVVTMAGGRHASRVGASIMTRLGLTELVAEGSVERYSSIACGLADDRSRLQKLRSSLRTMLRTSEWCDQRGFIRRLEEAYTGMLEGTPSLNPRIKKRL